MDARRVIESDGYTRRDLTADNRNALEWLRELESDFKDYSDEYLEFCDEDIESAEQILEAVAKWMEVKIAEYQVCIIEGQ